MDIILGLERDLAWLSPPLKKGDLGGFQEVILNPPYPLFQRGVITQSFSMVNQLRNIPPVARAHQTFFGLRRPSLPHNFGYCLRIEKQKPMMRKFFSGKKGIAL
jgi:hypothetical protein